MSEFTAEKAREIAANESYSTLGYVIDQITKAATNKQLSVTIKNLNLLNKDKETLKNNGFSIVNKTISWKENS